MIFKSFSRLILFSVALPLLFSCSAKYLEPSVAEDDLYHLKTGGHPSFSGIGSISIKGSGQNYSGAISLAIEKEKYRLELVDKTGATTLAVAGEPGRMIRVNTRTGAKQIITGDKAAVLKLHRIRVPVSLLHFMVTGSPPDFSRVVTASAGAGFRKAKVDEPNMEIEYSSKVERITIASGSDGGKIIVTPGPRTPGPFALYVSSVNIIFDEGSVEADIVWKKVRQNVKFPAGFFSFDEPLD